MKLSELILAVGDENVQVQNLMEAISNVRMRKNRLTEVSFITSQMTPNDVMQVQPRTTGLVLWIPTDKLNAARDALNAKEVLD